MTLKDVMNVNITGTAITGLYSPATEEVAGVAFYDNPEPYGEEFFLLVMPDGRIISRTDTITIQERIALLQALAKEPNWRDEIVERLLEAGCSQNSYGNILYKDLPIFRPSTVMTSPFIDASYRCLSRAVFHILADGLELYNKEQEDDT